MAMRDDFIKKKKTLERLCHLTSDAQALFDFEFKALAEEWKIKFGEMTPDFYKTEGYVSAKDKKNKAEFEIYNIINFALAKWPEREASSVVTVLAFLDIYVSFYSSGYIKERIFKIMKNDSLDESLVEILRDIFLNQLEFGRREYKHMLALWPKIDSLKLRDNISKRFSTDKRNPIIKRFQDLQKKLSV